MMNQLSGNSLLFGGNAPFVEELYENYLDNPASVPGDWREYFDKLAQLPSSVSRDVPHLPVVQLLCRAGQAGRLSGHQQQHRSMTKNKSAFCKVDQRLPYIG